MGRKRTLRDVMTVEEEAGETSAEKSPPLVQSGAVSPDPLPGGFGFTTAEGVAGESMTELLQSTEASGWRAVRQEGTEAVSIAHNCSAKADTNANGSHTPRGVWKRYSSSPGGMGGRLRAGTGVSAANTLVSSHAASAATEDLLAALVDEGEDENDRENDGTGQYDDLEHLPLKFSERSRLYVRRRAIFTMESESPPKRRKLEGSQADLCKEKSTSPSGATSSDSDDGDDG